ncbi:MAG: glycine cleavage system H protein [Deltaproteobacteria bacterium CSP1-8]|jgi:glycine cleavage system H protein|nr:MAG: glycine cleavage system H protein [Deltaproteobacteria bacterium CSP1-8]
MADESELKFSEDHLWVLEMGDTARIGLSDYAQEQLGEILSVMLGENGKTIGQGEAMGELESQKTVVELVSPLSGTIRAGNENVVEDPSLINVDPYGKGWLIEVEITEPEELEQLMNHDQYELFIED